MGWCHVQRPGGEETPRCSTTSASRTVWRTASLWGASTRWRTLPSALEAALAGRGGLVILVGELTRQPRFQCLRVRLHRHIAEAMERLYTAHLESHLGQLAYHFTEAAQGGGADKAISYAVRAGMRSMALLANEEAVGFYHMALEVWNSRSSGRGAALRCRLLLTLGKARRKTERFPRPWRRSHVPLRSPFGWVCRKFRTCSNELRSVTWRAGEPSGTRLSPPKGRAAATREEDSAQRARILGVWLEHSCSQAPGTKRPRTVSRLSR